MHWRTIDGDDILHEHGWQASQQSATMAAAVVIGNNRDDGGGWQRRCVDVGTVGTAVAMGMAAAAKAGRLQPW